MKMGKWDLYGADRKDAFDAQLDPHFMEHELRKYQEVFDEDFGIRELLMLKDIQAKSLIAETIADAPEFLIAQIGKGKKNRSIYGIVEALDIRSVKIFWNWYEGGTKDNEKDFDICSRHRDGSGSSGRTAQRDKR